MGTVAGTVDCVGVGSFLVGLMCAGLVRIRVLVIIEFVMCGYDAAVALRCMLLTVAVMLTVSRIFRSRFRNPKLIWDFMFPFPKTLLADNFYNFVLHGNTRK